MKIVIIEDEQIASQQLSNFIKKHDASAEIITVLRSVQDCLQWFASNEMPDLVFSDIELLDGNVFNVYEQIKITCPIIFSTAYDQYLLNAFQVNGISYLLKPFDFEQFCEAMKKYESLKNSFNTIDSTLSQQLQQLFSPTLKTYKKRFSIRMKGGIYLLNTIDIVYLKTEDGLLLAYDAKGRKYPLNNTLSQVKNMLDPNLFFQINRSEMINIQFIQKLAPYFKDRLAIYLKNVEHPLITSSNRTPELRRWLEA